MIAEHNIVQKIEINKLSLQLRNAYYNTTSDEDKIYTAPYGGHMTDSIGAWPEFILRGTFCKRSQKGLCSPCFYSRFPLSKANRIEYLNMIKQQIMYIVSNFDELVVRCQYGQDFESDNEISLVLTPTGSFFDDYEFPIEMRLEMEQSLIKISNLHNINIHLYIESHCEDFVKYDISESKCKLELDLLSELNTKVIFGFESHSDYSRNVVYNKDLSIEDFESAINKLKLSKLTPGAFVFAGLFSYNDLQTHDDVIDSVKYLLEKNVFPVLMFQNAQAYTITDVLLKSGDTTIIEPLTVAWIVDDFLKLLKNHNSYWLIADPIGGPPEPDFHIFKSPKMTCKICSDLIYEKLVRLRTTRNAIAFHASFDIIKKCECYKKYLEYINTLPSDCLFTQRKTDELIQKCKKGIMPYLHLITGGIK